MQFSGFFQSDVNDAPFMMAHLKDGKGSFRENIAFMIDTGLSDTSLSLKDLMDLGLDVDNLKKEEGDAYTATDSADVYSLEKLVLIFMSDKGEQLKLNFPKIFVSKSRNHENEKIAFNSPSLLGRNALYLFSLFMDRKNDKIILEFDENSIKKN
ncbi:MAG: hypothetical protein HY295_00220 [Thaumarchaeota archaeon]|nr:hypothetical protein [Nitrososphaerota archaeon]